MVRYLAVYNTIDSFEKGKTYLFVGRKEVGKRSLTLGLARHEDQINKKSVLVYKAYGEDVDEWDEDTVWGGYSERVQFIDITRFDELKAFIQKCMVDVDKTKAEMIFIEGIEHFIGDPYDTDYSKEKYKDTAYLLKNLALELNIPIIAAFQVNKSDGVICREDYGDDYRLSGIDQTIIMFDAKTESMNGYSLISPNSIDKYKNDTLVECVGLHYDKQNWNHYIGWSRNTLWYFDIPIKVLVFGAEDATYLPIGLKRVLDEYVSYNCEFIVGDHPGADTLVQEYLLSIGYKNVVVYFTGESLTDCRVNLGNWKVKFLSSELISQGESVKGDFKPLEKIEWMKLEDHDQFIALESENRESLFRKIFNPLYYYETSGYFFKTTTKLIQVTDGNKNNYSLDGPLEIQTPNGGSLHVFSNENDDDICSVKTAAGYTIDLGRKYWGYRIPNGSSLSECEYYELIFAGVDKEQIPSNFLPPFRYSQNACIEDWTMVSIEKLLFADAVPVNGESMMALLDLAHYVKECSYIEPIVVSVSESGEFKIIAGKRRILACLIAGIKEVPCRYISNNKDTTVK